ncbi:Histone deacetylase complex subunit 2/3 [Penicillium sp. DV-2018c]|nr:Histone deacetylase complex subunit 2/3 [Penicillium sp. DV-2018c]
MLHKQLHPKLDNHCMNHTDDSPAQVAITSDSGESSEHSDGGESDDQEWPIKGILRETKTQYLIDWEGPYEPSWEPKENASAEAVQIWNNRNRQSRGRTSGSLASQGTCESSLSPSLTVVSTPSETRSDSADEDSSDIECKIEPSDTESNASSDLFVHQENLSEIVASLTSQRVEASGCPPASTSSSPLSSLRHCSPDNDASAFEYVPETPSPPADLQLGELDEATAAVASVCGPPCNSQPHSVTRCSLHQQHLAGNREVSAEPSDPATPGLGLCSSVSEIGKAPAQPVGPRSVPVRFDSDNRRPDRGLIGSVTGDSVLVQWTCVTIPETIAETISPNLSQNSDDLILEGSIQSIHPIPDPLSTASSAHTMENRGADLAGHLSDGSREQSGDLSTPAPNTTKKRNAWAQQAQLSVDGLTQTAHAVETPSSVDDIEATVPPPVPETTAPLSVRADADLFPHPHIAVHHGHSEPLLPPSELAHADHAGQPSFQTIHPGALTVTGMDEEAPGSVKLGPSEFAITLPMDSRVKDDYECVLTDAAASIRQFFESFQPSSQISEVERVALHTEMRQVINRLSNVSTHPDLNISEHLKDPDHNLEKQASWAEYSSAKFLFLGHLIEIVDTHELHIILAVQDQKKQGILERYLRGKGFSYTRPREKMGSDLEVSLAKGSLSFGIHSSESPRELYKPPSAIFALDSYFNPKSPSMQHIRTTYARNGSLLPVIWFLVANTTEHIERCLPDAPEPDRLRLLVHYIARFHDEVGDLQDDALGVHEDAEEILGYLLDSVAGWPLPPIEPLRFVSLEDLERYSPGEAMASTPKRALDEESGTQFSKRARVGTQANTQATVSTSLPSQTLDQDLTSLETNLLQMRNVHAAEKSQLEAELARSIARCHELEQALSKLQHRYEDRTNEMHVTRQKSDQVAAKMNSIEQRVEKQKETISTLKEERSDLKRQLDEARQALKDGGGSPAELEAAREEVRRLQKENLELVRKAEFEKNQSEYTREQYQNASSAAAQSGTENRQLVADNEALKRKADTNVTKLREMHMSDESVRHIARIEELEMMLATRDEFLRRREDELREIRKNRPSTRSTSTQPRSPKWAANSRPTSPGVAHNGNGNGAIGGRGSALRYSSEMPF